MRRYLTQLLALLLVPTALLVAAAYDWARYGFQRYPKDPVWRIPGGNPSRAPAAFDRYGCAGCHVIPGMRIARGRVGPRLDRLFEQTYIAGVAPNTPDHMIQWLRHPLDVNPRTAMPDLKGTDQDARDMAAYLYEIR